MLSLLLYVIVRGSTGSFTTSLLRSQGRKGAAFEKMHDVSQPSLVCIFAQYISVHNISAVDRNTIDMYYDLPSAPNVLLNLTQTWTPISLLRNFAFRRHSKKVSRTKNDMNEWSKNRHERIFLWMLCHCSRKYLRLIVSVFYCFPELAAHAHQLRKQSSWIVWRFMWASYSRMAAGILMRRNLTLLTFV